MKIFISWSGERSKVIAKAFTEWLPDLFPSTEIFLSVEIGKGTRGIDEIEGALSETDFGIVCLTPENKDATWIHYEAGALAKLKKTSRLWTFLYELRSADVKPPLGNFQHTENTKEDIFRLVDSINEVSNSPHKRSNLERNYEKWFPDFSEALSKIPALKKTAELQTNPERDTNDMFAEILDHLRSSSRDNSSLIMNDLIRREAEAAKFITESQIEGQVVQSGILSNRPFDEQGLNFEAIVADFRDLFMAFNPSITLSRQIDARTNLLFNFEIPIAYSSFNSKIALMISKFPGLILRRVHHRSTHT